MTEHPRETRPYATALDAIARDLDDPSDGVPGLLNQAITVCAFVGSLSDEGLAAWWPILNLQPGERAEAVLLGQEATGHLSAIMKLQASLLRQAQQRLEGFLAELVEAQRAARPRRRQEDPHGHG